VVFKTEGKPSKKQQKRTTISFGSYVILMLLLFCFIESSFMFN